MKFTRISFGLMIMAILMMSFHLPVLAVSVQPILGYADGKFSKAVFNTDGSITITGSTKDKTIKKVSVYVRNQEDENEESYYDGDIGPDGSFKITTSPLKGFTYIIYFVAGDNYFYDEYIEISKKLVTYSMLEKLKTKSEIKRKWNQLSPKHEGEFYIEKPLLKAPYKAGSLKQTFLNDALNMTNYVRFLANMNPNITLSKEEMISAQHKAVLLEVNYNPANPHHPSKPKDMSDQFFETANPGWENLHFGQYSLARAVEGFMDDPGSHNLQRVGHRTSILHPNLTQVGFGYSGYYSVMHMDSGGSRNFGYQYDTISWPSAGNFPINFAYGASVWSLELNNRKFEEIEKKKVKITMTNQRTKKKWQLINPIGYIQNGYFYANPYLLTFKPNDLQYEKGDTITVKVEGLQNSDGTPTSLTYDVHLFDLDEITVNIDGKEQRYTQPPVVSQGRTMVPMRSIFETLGATVVWDGKTQTVTAKKGTTTVKLTIGSKTAYINNKKITIDASPIVLNQKTTMVPIRFISQALETKLQYDQKLKIIDITTKK
ncbi:stalk domain-containing protein [Pseudoneobacillus sp. C159]